jgi:hypothetical protein
MPIERVAILDDHQIAQAGVCGMCVKRSAYVGCLLLAAAFFVCQSGCVQRRMMVRSNPSGALVYVDDQAKPIGVTPCSHDFTYYGTRKFRLVKEGYETVTEMREIPAPWYEYPGIDFVAENFVPGQIRDQRTLDFNLTPQLVVSSDQILSRGEELRRGIHSATGTTSQLAPRRTATGQPAGWQPAASGAPSSAVPLATPYSPTAPTAVPPTGAMPNGIGGQPTYPLP